METVARAYEGKRVLVSGANGYLATNLVQALLDVDCQLVRLSRHPERLARPAGAVQIRDLGGDIREPGIWQQALKDVQVVFHFAAQTSAPTAAADPQADLRSNVLPMLHLLESSRQQGSRPVVLFSGTATQMGLPSSLPVSEAQSDCPVTLYDLHKLVAENYLKFYAAQGHVRGASLRLANVYGPGPRSSSGDRGVLNTMIRRALAGEKLTVYGEGKFVRDYVYIDDVIRAFLLAGIHPDATNGRHFVIGSGQGQSLADAFRLVAERAALLTGVLVPVEHVTTGAAMSPIDRRNFVADTRAFTQATGWTSVCDLSDGVERTMKAFDHSLAPASQVQP